jgi:extracellular elastinolytic metalloproteinase
MKNPFSHFIKSISLLFFFSFLSPSFYGQDIKQEIQNYLQENREKNGLTETDIRNWEISSQSYSKKLQVSHVYIRQISNGIPISNGLGNFAIKNGIVVNFANRLVTNIESKVSTTTPSISASDAIIKSAEQLNLGKPKNVKISKTISPQKFEYEKSGISRLPIPVELMYYLDKNNLLILVWSLSIKDTESSNWWSLKIDATTGILLDKSNWTVSCNFENCGNIDHASHQIEENQNFSTLLQPASANGSHYNVFPIPTESPNHGPRVIVSDPSNTTASPNGWHDTDGLSGNEYTITRGNNVYASEDVDNDDVPGYSPEGGSSLNFDFPLNQSISPSLNLDPAITNLFYMNNIMHDVWYQYGFDEESGNFQENNYGKGGQEVDYVFADAQDGSGTDNANFGTPPDGQNPRMQMYLWSVNSLPDALVVHSPSTIANSYDIIKAGFSPPLPTTPITSDFVLVEDGTSPDNNDGCETILNASSLFGKIAIMKRGNCTFQSKAQAAQDAGASAVIIINNTNTAIFAMSGDGSGNIITIPTVMISQANGQLILNQINLSNTVNGSIQNGGGVQSATDANFDNVVIAHEYGHGISTRLTGGPSNSDCLNNDEQMGEGWSDWFGLMLTMKSTDISTTKRGIGTFVTGTSTTSTGIRNAPYTTSFTVNPYTYNATNNTTNVSLPHGIGFVWCTMLWDLNWAFINKYGFDADVYNGTGGNNKLMHIVIEALKLQPCSPGFVDGRDAILAADQILNNGENKCMIWSAFAKRGLGYSADQGSSSSRSDQVEAFDLPSFCTAGMKEMEIEKSKIYPNPTNHSITINFNENQKIEKLIITDMQGKTIFDTELIEKNSYKIDMSKFSNGFYNLSIISENGNENIRVVKE